MVKSAAKKLKRDNPDVIFLRHLLASGAVDPDDDPKNVWNAHARLREYKLKNFRLCFKNTAADVMANKEAGKSAFELQRHCSFTVY